MSYSTINVSFISAAYNLCSYSSASDKTAEIRGLLKASAYGYVNLADTVNYLAGGGFVAVIYIGTEISYKTAALNLCRKVFYVNFAFNGNVFYCSLCRKAKKTDVFCANGYGHIFYRMVLTVKASYISVGNISDRRPFLIVEVNICGKNGVCRCGCSIVYLCGEPRKLLCGANLVNAVHLCRFGNGGAVPAFAAALCQRCRFTCKVKGVHSALLRLFFGRLLFDRFGQRFFLLLFLHFNLLKLNRVNFIRQCRYGAKAYDHHHCQKQR